MQKQIVLRPVISEKTLQMANEQNVYTFEVDRNAHKQQIKTMIQQLYGVDVENINTSRLYRVKKRTGRKRMPVLVAPRKKAMVTLKAGQNISVFDTGK